MEVRVTIAQNRECVVIGFTERRSVNYDLCFFAPNEGTGSLRCRLRHDDRHRNSKLSARVGHRVPGVSS